MINVQDTPVAQLEGQARSSTASRPGRIGAGDLAQLREYFRPSRR
jgi:hypothetical protein